MRLALPKRLSPVLGIVGLLNECARSPRKDDIVQKGHGSVGGPCAVAVFVVGCRRWPRAR